MRIFISAGEPSGDLHGANLIRSLRQQRPDIEFVGFGGPHMEAAGARLLYPLCQLAVMWFLRVLLNATTFLKVLSQADRYFRHHRPDAVILIDYPGFHWWLGRRAHSTAFRSITMCRRSCGRWAGWRVEKMRRFVDHVLCSLPFEEAWYRERGVAAHYVGHPYFDELPRTALDMAFLSEQRERPGTVIGLLPGSRTQEVERTSARCCVRPPGCACWRPDMRFLVAAFKESHREYIVGRCANMSCRSRSTSAARRRSSSCRTHARRSRARSVWSCCIAASRRWCCIGISPLDLKVGLIFKKSKYISLVNLLADAELYPEYLTDHCESKAISGHLVNWLNNPAEYETVCEQLRKLREQVAIPGASERAARFVLTTLAGAEPLAA